MQAMLALAILSLAAAPQEPPRAQRLTLRDVTGGPSVCFPPSGRKPVCFIFVLAECPVANKFAPEIKRIHAKYRAKGVPFYLVHVDPDTTPTQARRHAKAFGYRFPVFLDPRHTLAGTLGATHSPEAVVWAGGRVAYQGRINDLYARLGVRRKAPTTHDLRAALDAVLVGRPVKVPRTPVVGCVLPPTG